MRHLTLLALVFLAACSGDGAGVGPTEPTPPPPDPDSIPLKTLAGAKSRYFGTAVPYGAFNFPTGRRTSYLGLLSTHFSMLTPENEMKHSVIYPTQATYSFAQADSLVSYALAHGMAVRGHTLAWHSQNASWLTALSASWTLADSATARALLVAHIDTVVKRYKGKIHSWDVVNEALADNGTLRESPWFKALGQDFIAMAFHAARAADSSALLFINDYSIEHAGPKSDSLYALVQELLADGVPIDGVGFQAHFIAGTWPSFSDFSGTMARFTALGLKAQITELDVRIQLPTTGEKLTQQAANYADAVNVCLQNLDCDAIVVWGVSDGESWIPGTFAGYGDALLFDAAYGKKPAFRSVYALLKP